MARQTLQREILDELGRQIVSGTLRPNQVLRTEDLVGEHDVSRTVLRETLKVLESMNLVAIRRRVGITVQARSEWNVYDPRVIAYRLDFGDREAQLRSLTELRLAVEPIAARSAASRATAAQRDELRTIAARMQESGRPRDTDTHLERDVAFHTLLLRAAGNEMFAALSGPIVTVLKGRIAHHLMPEDPTTESLDLHTQVADAIAAGAADAAESAMRAIVSEVTQQLPDPDGAA